MRQGDVVLIWGAGGGLGGFALQHVLAGGGYPVCVVSSEAKAQKCRDAGAEWIINRADEDYRFWDPESGQQNPREHLRLGKRIRELSGGRDVDIVFEHPGRDTFGASVFVTRRGGKVVTCASTTGFMHEFDNRYLWMFAKTIVGSHLANYREGWAANELCRAGRTHPDPQPQLSPHGGRPGVRRRARERPPGQGRRALPGRGRGRRRARPRVARAAPSRHHALS